MKVFIVLCIIIAPILGQLILPAESEPPAFDYTPEYTPPKFSPRITNGKFAGATQFPWQVSIQPLNSVEAALVRCSGSLISSNRILTAAHCVRDYTAFQLGFGSIDINTPAIEQIVNRTNIVIHPRYNSTTLNNDIAIIRLRYDVPFNSVVKTIRLPRREQNTMDSFASKMATVSGWGRTTDGLSILSDLLRYANLNVTTNAYCKIVYGGSIVINATVCGVGIPVGSSPCGGDSGSPLALVDTDGGATQIGIFSFIADSGCSKGFPAGFTFVAPYLDWISQHTGIPILN